MMSPEQLIDHIAKHQSYRMNDQRSEVNLLPLGLNPASNQENLELFVGDLLERCEDSRFDDQRTALPPLPESTTLPENEFLDTIQRIQISGRMDEQRTSLPPRGSSVPQISQSSTHLMSTNGHTVMNNRNNNNTSTGRIRS